MPERTVSVGIVADMSNYLAGMQRGSAATAALGKQAQTSGELTRAFVSKVGGSISSLGNQVGGTVGQLLSTVGAGIDTVASKSAHLSTALEVGGGAAVAAGIGLEQLGSGAVQATDQLDTAINNAGDSVSDYTSKIDAAVAAGENLNHSEEDTKAALTALIPAAGSTQKALDLMQVVTNLAAAKHETLATAATAVARVLGGNGSRTLSVYGIQMDGVGTKTEQGTRALAELETKLSGQASASVNNFGGQVGIMTTHVEDFVKDAATPAGVALSVLGVGATVAGAAIDLLRLRQDRAAAATIAATVAQTTENVAVAESVAPLEAEAVAAATAGVSLDGLATSTLTARGAVAAFATGPGGLAIFAAAALYGVDAVDKLSDAAANNTIKFNAATDAAAAYQKQLSQDNTGFIPDSTARAQRATALTETSGANAGVGQFATSIGLGDIDAGFTQSNESIAKIDASMANLVKSGNAKEATAQFKLWEQSAKDAGISLAFLKSKFPDYISSLGLYGGAASSASDKTSVLSGSFNAAALNASFLKTDTDELEKSLSTYGASAQSAEQATENYQASLDAVNKSIKENGKDHDDATAKGRANNQTLYAEAAAANSVADANLKNKKPLADVEAALESARAKLITNAEAMGYNAQQAKKLADQLIQQPFKYTFNDGAIKIATNDLTTYLKELAKIPQSVQLPYIHTAPGSNKGFAAGGVIPGPASFVDNRLTPMASGEGVVTTRAMQRPGNAAGVAFMNAGGNISSWMHRTAFSKPVYVSAPAAAAVNNYYLSVPVTLNGHLVGNDLQAAKALTDLVTKGVNAGVVSQGWNKQ